MIARRPLVLALAACALVGAAGSPPALADATPVATPRLSAVDGAIRASARRERLPVVAVQPAGPGAVLVASTGAMPREAFLRRASLVAYAAFQQKPGLHTIVFEHADAAGRQVIRVSQQDLADYLADRIARGEYQRRVGWRAPAKPAARPAAPAAGARAGLPKAAVVPPAPRVAPPIAPPPALPKPAAGPDAGLRPPSPPALPPQVVPIPDLPAAPTPARGGAPIAPVPAMPALALPKPAPAPAGPSALVPGNDVTVAWAVGLGRGAYDAYALEYDHPLLPTLSLRPALWILSGFSPLNRMGGSSAMDGLSAAVDLMGSTRRQVGPAQIAFEGGLGARATSLLATPGGWPAAHLRVGARWQALGVAMRYPLLTRGGDPTATWEASVGFTWAFGGAVAP